MRLIADVGGTNTRMALSADGRVLPGTSRSFVNRNVPTFEAVLRDFLSDTDARPEEIVVAIAGPVNPGRARLTNHDWSFDAAALARDFGARRVAFINDLKALGHALPALGPDGLIPVAHTETAGGGSQSLVAGIGTGFNVSPVLWTGGTAQSLRSEHGHLSLPQDVTQPLRDRLGAAAEGFVTVEDVFSGAGLGAVLAAMTGQTGKRPEEILADADAPGVAEARAFYAGLIGRLARNLKMAFMPDAGLYFSGSVARSILTSPARADFIREYDRAIPLEYDLAPPVWIIRDDTAALKGCALLDVDQEA
ncbi:glucokinase [Pseudooceanicola sp.]|uniref:glucokinase n=1 Tax=Pseudooceanicola sp. TaxID=1914328 RepID=UPI00405A1AAC